MPLVIDDNELKIDQQLVEQALSKKHVLGIKLAGSKGKYEVLMKLCRDILHKNSLQNTRSEHNKEWYYQNFLKLANMLGIEKMERIEIYDNSHFATSNPVGAVVACNKNGFDKSQYRIYKLNNSDGDDYKMMEEMIERRFSKTSQEKFPQLLIIDGGLAHHKIVKNILLRKGLSMDVIAIAKGKDRNSGREKIYDNLVDVIDLPINHSIRYFLQILRDEAHRFAISQNRKRNLASITYSELNDIPEIGPERKKRLLMHFGSVAQLRKASESEISKVHGIDRGIASMVYNYLNKKSQ